MPVFTGVILAGGQGSRMGGRDKGLVQLHNQPLYQHVLQRLQPQVDSVLISANRHLDQYQLSGCKVITDTLPDWPGPLAGMLSGLRHSQSEWVVFCACDTPYIPQDFVLRLWQQRAEAPAVWVRSAMRDHPVLALLNRALADELATYLARGERRLMQFLRASGGHAVLFEENERVCRNINTADDLAQEQGE